ncbi:MAG TPA: ATP synthase F0 subunit B [Candidatus Acidoferrum sp.]|nr:ATP synthase F0 subunit B [Candidatus Acidoferrum sp.]
MFLALDGTFLVQLANFAIFFALLSVVFLRPVSSAIRKRREYINSLTTDYDQHQAQGKALREQAESIRAAARRDAEAIMTKARAEASNTTAELASSYGAQVQATIEQADATVTAELEKARDNERDTVQQLANLILERTLSEPSR